MRNWNARMRTQGCGYWSNGANAQGHQHPRFWQISIAFDQLLTTYYVYKRIQGKWQIMKENYLTFAPIKAGWCIFVGKSTVIGSNNGLSPERRQAIIRTIDGLLLIWRMGTNFSDILIEIYTVSFKRHSKLKSGSLRPFGLGLNV